MGWAKYTEDNLELMLERMGGHEWWTSTPENSCSTPTRYIPPVITAEKEDLFIDKLMYCKSCGKTFLFSASAQKVYKQKGMAPPKECKYCKGTSTSCHSMQSTV